MKPCSDYRPDHNGECLNCDEPYEAHIDERIKRLEAQMARLQKAFITMLAWTTQSAVSPLRVEEVKQLTSMVDGE